MGKEEEEKKEDEVKPPEGKGKSSKMKMIIIVLIAVVALGGGGFYAWKSGFLFGSKEKKNAHAATPALPKIEVGPSRSMDTFIVNLADPGGKRYLKVKMDLELSDEKLMIELDKRMPQLRDAILTTLSSKAFEDISGQDGKIQLRAEMMAMLNQYLKSGKVKNIYFTEFVVQ
jgi:flagellar protein FliL